MSDAPQPDPTPSPTDDAPTPHTDLNLSAARDVTVGEITVGDKTTQSAGGQVIQAQTVIQQLRWRLAGLSVLLLMAVGLNVYVFWQANRAEQQAQTALARQLAVQVQQILASQPAQLPRAVLLSIESLRRYPESAGNEALGESFDLLTRELSHLTHDDVVLGVAISPDGQWVVSGSDDGTARVWRWRNDELIELACSRLTRNLTQAEWRQYLGDEPYRKTCENLPEGE